MEGAWAVFCQNWGTIPGFKKKIDMVRPEV